MRDLPRRADRGFVPARGDSSSIAAARFLNALEDIVLSSSGRGGTIVVVAHGGVTTDALRTLLGDDELLRRQPEVIDAGIPGGAITTLTHHGSGWIVESIAVTPDR